MHDDHRENVITHTTNDFDIKQLCDKLLSNTVIERYEIFEQTDS